MGIEIHQTVLKEMQKFSKDVLIQAKEAFAFLEAGEKLSMPLSRPMPTVWIGCHELRIRDRQEIYRIFYVIISRGSIFIPHCFQKKTQATPKKEIQLAQRRIKEFLDAQ